MWRITEFRAPFVHYRCGCGRQFIEEEMYVCFKCEKGVCRFCMDEEIDYFFCRHCNDVLSVTEAQSQRYKCQRLLQCPICTSALSMSMTQPKKDNPNRTKYYHYRCSYCQWSTMHIDFMGENLHLLLMKFNFYKGKYGRSPQQIMYDKLYEIYKFNQEEHIKKEKYMLRSKKKTISYLAMPMVTKRQIKYMLDDLQRDQDAKQTKRDQAQKRLLTFDEVYQMKLEMEQLEKANQSEFNGTGNDDIFSESNNGMTPKQKRDIRFDSGITPKGTVGADGTIEGIGTKIAEAVNQGPNTSKGANVPKLSLDQLNSGGQAAARGREQETQQKKVRDGSGSNRGSIGRKERLRNALTGRSDGSGAGADYPKELPSSELEDFLLGYDKTEPAAYKEIRRKVEDTLEVGSVGDLSNDDFPSELAEEAKLEPEKEDSVQNEGGSAEGESSPVRIEYNHSSQGSDNLGYIKEVTFPSLDDALQMKLDLNTVTTLPQRLRNINSQPRKVNELYPAPFPLATRREKRCKDCRKVIIKPVLNPISTEKMKIDFQMLYYVPKVMIYRIGRYAPYKGPSQDIEIMLKFINYDDTEKAEISFIELDDVKAPLDSLAVADDSTADKETDSMKTIKDYYKPDSIKNSQTLNAAIDLPVGSIFIAEKDTTALAGEGTLLSGNAEEKRSKEEMLPFVTDPSDIGFMYKIVSNSNIMRFSVTTLHSFNLEKDELKFGFNIVIKTKRSSSQTINLKVPIAVNCGKLKANEKGGPAAVSSAQSQASHKRGVAASQEEQIKAGQAQVLDTSHISSATEKQKLDETFQSNRTNMTNVTSQSRTISHRGDPSRK